MNVCCNGNTKIGYLFFLCLFALALFFRLCVEIFALFLFLPLGMIHVCFRAWYVTDSVCNLQNFIQRPYFLLLPQMFLRV